MLKTEGQGQQLHSVNRCIGRGTYTEDGVGEELGQYLRFCIYIRSEPDNAAQSAVGDTHICNYAKMEFLFSAR